MVTPAEFWAGFCAANADMPVDEPYQTWHFGKTIEMAFELGQLVISVKKTATASLAVVNEIAPHEAPILGGYSVVTDFDGDPMAVIRTTEIRHIPFNGVDAQFAYDEGEGDQTLEYWREIHWNYFSNEAARLGIDLDERSIICCERFEFLYPK